MCKIKYSFISSSIQRNFYKRVCENIHAGSRGIPYEVVFAGDVPPFEKMPDNFRYIFTEVTNWSQCLEIAARHATGEYLIVTSDDYVLSPGFLEQVDYYVHRFRMDRSFISFLYRQNDIVITPVGMVIDQPVKNSPVIGVSGVFSKEMWHKLGGLDRRFPGAMADIDMVYRFYEKGLSLFIPHDIYINEIRFGGPSGQGNSMCALTGSYGFNILRKLWFKDNGFLYQRQDTVWPYIDDTILTKEQLQIDPMGQILPKIEFTINKLHKQHVYVKMKMAEDQDSKRYEVNFFNLNDRKILYRQIMSVKQEVICFLDMVEKVRIRVMHSVNGLVFQKTIKRGEDNGWKEF